MWYLLEIPLVACNVGTTLIGTVDFLEHQYSLRSAIKALYYGQETVWICSYCHSMNSATRTKAEDMMDLSEWMERIGLDPKDRRKMYICGAELCSFCRRIKRPVQRFWFIVEKISYVVAWVSILPFGLCLVAPFKLVKSLFSEFGDLADDNLEEFYQLLFENQV